MTAVLGSLEFMIPCCCYYILIKVCHIGCVSIIMWCVKMLFADTNIADGLFPMYVLEKEVNL